MNSIQSYAKKGSRDAILLAVWEVVADKGFASVTMRNVAKQADVSLGRVQYYFKTKDDLILESCMALVNTGAAETTENTSGEHSASDQLISIIGAGIPAGSRERRRATVLNAFVTQAMVEPNLAKILVDFKRNQERSTAKLLVALSEEGDGNGADEKPGSVESTKHAGASEKTEVLEYAEALGIARTLIALADGLAQRVLIGDLQRDDAMDILTWEIEDVFLN